MKEKEIEGGEKGRAIKNKTNGLRWGKMNFFKKVKVGDKLRGGEVSG